MRCGPIAGWTMAGLAGDMEMKSKADAQLKKAMPALEKVFWNGRTGYYSYGATEKGEKVGEKTPWPGVGMMFGLFDAERAEGHGCSGLPPVPVR